MSIVCAVIHGHQVPSDSQHKAVASAPLSCCGRRPLYLGLRRADLLVDLSIRHTCKQYKEIHCVPRTWESFLLIRKKNLESTDTSAPVFRIRECSRCRALIGQSQREGWQVEQWLLTQQFTYFFLMVMGRLKFCDLEVKVFVLNYQASELICLLNRQFLSLNFIFFLYDCISPIANSLFLLVLINCFHLLFFFWLISPLRKCALQHVLNSNKFIFIYSPSNH